MIIEGTPLEQADVVMAYCIANKVACLYYDLRTYNGLDATKKATVTAYYKDIVDEYVLDLMQSTEIYNILSFPSGETASVNGASWFPKKSLCPDADHFINSYVIDVDGTITWQNAETPPKKSS